jgi:hypothetical protein
MARAYAPDAQGGFVWIRGPRERTTSTVDVVLDWSDELARLAPPG